MVLRLAPLALEVALGWPLSRAREARRKAVADP